MMMTQPARLAFANGITFRGFAPSWQKTPRFGEVVFSTGMTGYPESLTDPSYCGQILVFTYPLIGNYGVPISSTWESAKIHAHGVVVSECAPHYSHSTAEQSLWEWLKAQNVPFLSGVDTRALTRFLRSQGSAPGAICLHETPSYFHDPNQEPLVARVSSKEKKTFGNGAKKVIVVDCGMKENILRSLLSFPITVEKVPATYDYSSEDFDGILLSNGPGDPEQCRETVAILQKAMLREKPIFGICLGIQMLALAIGAKTYKLPYGHRGHNVPCLEVGTERCFITSQNHGYAVNEATLPRDWQVSVRNLNDGTVEGIAHREKPFFAVQFHPEAAPGPTDTSKMFERFYQCL